MKNIKAVRRLMEQGIDDKTAKYLVQSIRDLGYSPEKVTKEMCAKQINETIASVDRALERAFK